MSEVTYTDHGAILSDAEGYVTHRILGPSPFTGNYVLYATDGYANKLLGSYDSVEKAIGAV